MNDLILKPDVQRFLNKHLDRDPHQVALSGSPFEGVQANELAGQIDSRQRCRHKLPTWFATGGLYYPRRLSVEQCSSEVAAAYKASLVPEDARVLDMTGGLGVDSYFFSERASEVRYMERDPELMDIARHNDCVLRNSSSASRGPIYFEQGDSTEHLRTVPADVYDLIYLDPARRVSGGKVFRLRDCEPNVADLQDLLLEKSRLVLIKASPMLDIAAARSEVRSIREVHVVSIAGECKELLLVLDRDYDGPVKIVAVAADRDNLNVYKRLAFTLQDEQSSEFEFEHPRQFIYEPDAALLKAGAFKYTAQHYEMAKISPHTHLYTNDHLRPDFMGKISTVEEIIPYSVFRKNKQSASGNVIAKNFPIRAEDLRKRHGIKEAQESNLYFCRNKTQELIVIRSVTVRVPDR